MHSTPVVRVLRPNVARIMRVAFALAAALGCSDGDGASTNAGAAGDTGAAGQAGAAGAGAAGAASGGAGSGDAGSSGTGGAGAMSGAGGEPEAGAGGSTNDAGDSQDGGDADGGGELTLPSLVDPCSDDLDLQRGAIAPDFGASVGGEGFTGDPNDDGPFQVLAVDTTIPNPDSAREALDATFYAPSNDGVAIADGAHPLALVMHGFGTTHRFYEHFTRHLASHGIVVLGITLPGALTAAHDKNAAEAIAAIDFALGQDAPQAVRGGTDAERIAVLGHSLGGKIAFYAAALDARIDLVVGWDPSNAGGPPCFIDPESCNAFVVAPNCLAQESGIVHQLRAESVVFRAAADGANPEPAHNAIHFYRGAPAPATLLDFDMNVLHGDFASETAAVIPHTRRVQLAFLLTRLRGMTGLEAYLPGGDALDDDALVTRVLYR
jgi:hypothetical protein